MNKLFIIKHLKISLIILFVCNISLIYAQTQPVEVVISTEKINLNGDIFYVHIVKKGETLYSIARAYNMSVNDIIAKNPQAANDIKVDQILRIPVTPVAQQATVKNETENNGEVMHVISTGQTLYGVARVYGVSVTDIEQANPGVKFDSLKVGQQLIIPIEKKKQSIIKPSDTTKYAIHKIAEKETLYSLARKYNVKIEEITGANEGLEKEGLIIGKEIRIPILLADTLKKDSVKNSSLNALQPNKQLDCNQGKTTLKGKEIDVAIMLPLFSSGNIEQEDESADDNQNEEKIQLKPSEEFNPLGMNFIEYYQGVLMAVDELKRQGLNVRLHVYDTEKSIAKIGEIINSAEFKKNNIIIGPVFPEQIARISAFAKENEIFVVSPITNSEDVLKTNPFLFQINPGLSQERDESINLLLNDSAENIIVIYNSSLTDSTQIDGYKKMLRSKLGAKTDSIKEVYVFNNDFTQTLSSLDSLKCNYVLSPSIDEIFVTNLLSVLSTKLIYCRIHVIGMMEWTRFKGIDMNYLHDLQLAYNSAYYTDYESDEVKDFLKKYRLFFGTDPYKTSKYGFNYCMLGYDVTNYFLKGYATYGKSFRESLPCIKTKSLVAPLKFINLSPGAGFINTHMQTVQYCKDYSVQRVDVKNK
jgi:LysM repeat protein/ABC-type branched-subunit amino acid transport system substrate-binding protein